MIVRHSFTPPDNERLGHLCGVLDEHLPLALDVMCDMAARPRFEAEALESEREVVLEEIAMIEDDPSDLVHDLAARCVFGEHELGRPARLFCYPGGFYSPREVELVRECGFRAAVTCEFGANAAPFDHNELHRTIVERSDPLWLFRARLAGATEASTVVSIPNPEMAVAGGRTCSATVSAL